MNNINRFKKNGDEVLVFTNGKVDDELSSEAIKKEVDNNQELYDLLAIIESFGFISNFSVNYPTDIYFSNSSTYDGYVYALDSNGSRATYGYELADNWRLREYGDYPRE